MFTTAIFKVFKEFLFDLINTTLHSNLFSQYRLYNCEVLSSPEISGHRDASVLA